MNERKRFFARAAVCILVAMAAIVIFGGCSKKQPLQEKPVTAGQASSAQPAAETVAIEQKTCPVMEGNPIDPNLFVEYKGKKVYFCCKGCPEKFLANPEKYLAKLPQFQQ
ncbi:MAG TPA: YHS domain-containing protein [Sedimentisphaerales bacterium]|jgi:YHS domain-containing protein|nr:YHS domain-containing protein [Sedimentisphaerales bacterium]HNU30676.1 YHS domain-containing protein [Sedimentisphaerales bacterium]